MTVKPRGARVIVLVDKPETKTASGIYLPGNEDEKLNTAIIKEVGPGTEKEPMEFKVGEKILFEKYAGTQLRIDGVEHLVLNTSSIIAVIEDEESK